MHRVTLLVFLCSLIYADPTKDSMLDNPATDPLNITVNSASKRDQSLLNSPSAMEVISKNELELLKCNRLSECLEFATGISSLNAEGNVFQTSTIRGNTLVNHNTHTLLLIDGIPIRNPYNGTFNLDIIPLSSIQRIELLKGANSVLYGSNAINGVINIITVKSETEEMLRTRYGSFNTLHSEISMAHDFTKGSLRLFADRTSSDEATYSIYDEDNRSRDFAQEYEVDALVAKASYKDLWVHLQFYDRHIDNYQTRGFVEGFPSVDAREGNSELEYLVAFGFDLEIDRDFALKFKTAYHDWSLDKRRTYAQWEHESWSWYHELELHMFEDSKNHNVLGISLEQTNAQRYRSETGGFDVGEYDEQTHNSSLYDNGNYHINDAIDLVYGGRYSISSYRDTINDEVIHNHDVSLRAGLLYAPIDELRIKALYSQAYRNPTYLEKEVRDTGISPNVSLESERSESFDLVLIHKLDSFYYSADLFYTAIKEKIDLVDIGGGIQENQNTDNIYYYGLELNTKFSLKEGLSGFLGYAYTKEDKGNAASRTNLIYEHMLTGGISQHAFDNLRFNSAVKYLDSWGDASAYILMNISMEYSFESLEGLSVEAIANNILNEEIDLPEIGRNHPNVPTIPKDHDSRFYLGFKYTF